MNLHYMEYLEGVRDDSFSALVDDWIQNNPPGLPRVWRDSWNSYTLSLRAVVWMQQLALRGNRLPAATIERTAESLAGQISFLERNLETDLGGNHLIKNIKALIWASAYFSGTSAIRWRRKGCALLGRELDRQILSDGVHYERSASYHTQVFSDLMECRHALGADPLGGKLDDVLHRMARATAAMAHPDGGPVLFNDAGLSMAYAPQQCLDVYARLLARTSPECPAVFALPAAGYYGGRWAESYFIADCGRIAPDDLPAHGHGDVLSFEWSVARCRIIVDQGVSEYVAGDRRQRSRAASSHNTLSLAGTDQADFFGSFRCGRRPNVTVRHYAADSDGFVLEGAHDGFAHIRGQPIHLRRFAVTADKVVIEDRIEGSTDRAAAAGFLLHPDCVVEIKGPRALITRDDVRIEVTSTFPIRSEPAVWWPDMGLEQATCRLRIELGQCAPVLTTTLRILSLPPQTGSI